MICLQVVGHFRSGTTLLASRLDGNQGIGIARESHFLRYRRLLDVLLLFKHPLFRLAAAKLIIAILRRNHWEVSSVLKEKIRASCLCEANTASVYISFLAAVLPGEIYVGDNTPRYVYDIKYLNENVALKTVICTRGLSSIAKSALRAETFGYGPLEIAWEYVKRERTIAMLKEALPESSFLLLDYDDLVENPMETEKRLEGLLGQKIDLTLYHSPRFFEVNKEGHHSNIHREIKPISSLESEHEIDLHSAVQRTEYFAQRLASVTRWAGKLRLEQLMIRPALNLLVAISSRARRLKY